MDPEQHDQDLIRHVADRLAISDFLSTYSLAVDSKDWALYRSLFAEGAAIDYTGSGGIAGGLDEVAQWMENTMTMFSATQHVITNELVTIDGDRATVKAVLFNPMEIDGETKTHFSCGGGYDIELVRDDSGVGWRASSLAMNMSWTTLGS